MEILYSILIFTGIIPGIIYLTLIIITSLKLVKGEYSSEQKGKLIQSITQFSIFAIIYATHSLISFYHITSDSSINRELLVIIIYIISILFCCADFIYKRHIGQFSRKLTASIIIFLFIIQGLIVHILFEQELEIMFILVKVVIVASYFFVMYVSFSKRFNQSKKMSVKEYNNNVLKNKKMLIFMVTAYTFIFLCYVVKTNTILDFYFAIYAFTLLHIYEYSRFKGLNEYYIFNNDYEEETMTLADSINNVYGHNIESDNFLYESGNVANMSLKNRLLLYFESEKPYLENNISIDDVAMKLYTNKTYLSKTINEELNKNFRELVNYFRIKEAMEIFEKDDSISINDLMHKCGFNNNASFTSAFKINTGFTPGEWCKDVKNRD